MTPRRSEGPRRQTQPRAAAWLALLALALAGAASAEPPDLGPGADAWRIGELTRQDRLIMESQRASISALTRRHLGSALHRSESDLQLLQRILDEDLVSDDDTASLQALGVVLGDVMAEELGLRWVVVEDALGRSAALRLGSTQTLIFPVTMISKRVEFGELVDVKALYAETKQLVGDERAGSAPHRPLAF